MLKNSLFELKKLEVTRKNDNSKHNQRTAEWYWNVEEWRHNLRTLGARAFQSLHEEMFSKSVTWTPLMQKKCNFFKCFSSMLNGLITDVFLEGTNCFAFEGTDFHSNWAHYGLYTLTNWMRSTNASAKKNLNFFLRAHPDHKFWLSCAKCMIFAKTKRGLKFGRRPPHQPWSALRVRPPKAHENSRWND